MRNDIPSMLHLKEVELLLNNDDSTSLILYFNSTIISPLDYSKLANSQVLAVLFAAIGVKNWETEQHADFTLTRFEYRQVVCLLTIDEICETLWIKACKQSDHTLKALKGELEKYVE